MSLQTIIFPKKSYTLSQAREWLKVNNYKYGKVDERKNTYRFRQRKPVYPARYYTKKLDNDIDLVFFEVPKY